MAYEQASPVAMSDKQRRMIMALTAKLGLEKPANINSLSSAEASAVIDRMLEMEAQRDKQAAAAKQTATQPTTPAEAQQAQPQQGKNLWRERNYDPIKAGLSAKLAVQEMVAGTKRPSIHTEVFVATSVEIYGALLELEHQLWKRHKDAQAGLAQ